MPVGFSNLVITVVLIGLDTGRDSLTSLGLKGTFLDRIPILPSVIPRYFTE